MTQSRAAPSGPSPVSVAPRAFQRGEQVHVLPGARCIRPDLGPDLVGPHGARALVLSVLGRSQLVDVVAEGSGRLVVESRSLRRHSGQAIVELAIIFPLLIFAAMGFLEAGRLVVTKAEVDRNTYAVAETAARYPDDERWQSVAARLLPAECDVQVHRDALLATASSRCQYRPLIFRDYDGIVISSEESAATAGPEPTPSPSSEPSAEGSVEP